MSQFKSHAKHESRKNFLGKLFDFPEGIMAIGRLDQASEGLLLLTTDGKVSYKICSSAIEKEYYVQVDGLINDSVLETLRKGVCISTKNGEYITLPCKAHVLKNKPLLPERGRKIRDDRHGPTSWVSITINEGKFRQVRRMTAAVGYPTLRLVRVRVGNVHLDTMQAGDVIEIDNPI